MLFRRLCFFALLITSSSVLQAADEQAGRWQLFQGEYPFINLSGEEHWIRGLFKLDTATGNMFVCAGYQIDGVRMSKPNTVMQITECRPFEKKLEFPK